MFCSFIVRFLSSIIAAEALETLLLPDLLLSFEDVADPSFETALEAIVLNDCAVPLLPSTVLEADNAAALPSEPASVAYWLLVTIPLAAFSHCLVNVETESAW